MKKLSEQLAELSARAAELEANAKSLGKESRDKLETKIASIKSHAETSRNKFDAGVKEMGEDVADAWADVQAAFKSHAEKIKAAFEAKRESIEEGHARRRADRLEKHAVSATEFALVSIDDAEYAIAEAIAARLEAETM